MSDDSPDLPPNMWPEIEGFSRPYEQNRQLWAVRSKDGGHWFSGDLPECQKWRDQLTEAPGGEFEIVTSIRSSLVYDAWTDWEPVTPPTSSLAVLETEKHHER